MIQFASTHGSLTRTSYMALKHIEKKVQSYYKPEGRDTGIFDEQHNYCLKSF